jgi:hypothetical protein
LYGRNVLSLSLSHSLTHYSTGVAAEEVDVSSWGDDIAIPGDGDATIGDEDGAEGAAWGSEDIVLPEAEGEGWDSLELEGLDSAPAAQTAAAGMKAISCYEALIP